MYWGALALSLLFVAPVACFMLGVFKGENTLKKAFWHLPFAQQFYLGKKCYRWFTTAKQLEMVKDRVVMENEGFERLESKKARKRLRKSLNMRILSDMSLQERLIEDMESIESDLQMFKSYEGFCEAAPQFVLQGTLWILLPSEVGIWHVIKVSSLIMSYTSLVFSASGICVKMSYVIDGELKVPIQSTKLRLIAVPLLAFVVTPRLASLCITYARCKGWPIAIMMVTSGFVHLLTYFCLVKNYTKLTVLQMTNQLKNNDLLREHFFLSWITSIILPCIVIDSEKPYLMYSGVSSTIGYVVWLIVFSIIVESSPETLRPWPIDIETVELQILSLVMIIVITLTLVFAYILCLRIRSKN